MEKVSFLILFTLCKSNQTLIPKKQQLEFQKILLTTTQNIRTNITIILVLILVGGKLGLLTGNLFSTCPLAVLTPIKQAIKTNGHLIHDTYIIFLS